jgi:hypothetical protein
MNKEQIQIAPNQPGWFALKHKDGWWVGTKSGVTCYRDKQIAMAANTVAFEREGRKWVYRICEFTAADKASLVQNGEHTPKFSAAQIAHRL